MLIYASGSKLLWLHPKDNQGKTPKFRIEIKRLKMQDKFVSDMKQPRYRERHFFDSVFSKIANLVMMVGHPYQTS